MLQKKITNSENLFKAKKNIKKTIKPKTLKEKSFVKKKGKKKKLKGFRKKEMKILSTLRFWNQKNFFLPKVEHKLTRKSDSKLRRFIKKFGFLRKKQEEGQKAKINYPLLAKVLRKVYTQRISILIKSNNMFCTLMNIGNNKTLYTTSAKLLGIKITKKKLRYVYDIVLDKFLKRVGKRKLGKIPGGIIFKITAPLKIKEQIYDLLCKYFIKGVKLETRRRIRFVFPSRKSFNGCRPLKKVRKKRKRTKFIN